MLSCDSAGDLSRDHGLKHCYRSNKYGTWQNSAHELGFSFGEKKNNLKECQKVNDTWIYLAVYLHVSIPNYIIYYTDANFESSAIFIKNE